MVNQENIHLHITIIDSVISKIEREIPMFSQTLRSHKNLKNLDNLSYDFLNVPTLIRLSVIDIAILFKKFIDSKQKTEKNLFGRLICGQLYEFCDDIPRICGKNYRKKLNLLTNSDPLNTELNSLMRSFNIIKDKYWQYLKSIRNNISSHKEMDVLVQLDLMENMEVDFIISAYIDIVSWFPEYFKFETKLLNIAMERTKDL